MNELDSLTIIASIITILSFFGIKTIWDIIGRKSQTSSPNSLLNHDRPTKQKNEGVMFGAFGTWIIAMVFTIFYVMNDSLSDDVLRNGLILFSTAAIIGGGIGGGASYGVSSRVRSFIIAVFFGGVVNGVLFLIEYPLLELDESSATSFFVGITLGGIGGIIGWLIGLLIAKK